jgi:hypothetical protein
MDLKKGLLTGVCMVIASVVATAQITGSGTTSKVPKFTTSTMIGDSVITESSGNVGIGTPNPQAALDVESGGLISTAAMYLNGSSVNSGNTSMVLNNRFAGGETYAVTAGIPNVDQAGLSINKLSGYTYGTEIQFISTPMLAIRSGNIGIGTVEPGSKLEINGGIRLTSGSGGSVTFADGTVQSTAWTGTLCGGDYAESVDVTGERNRYEPGDVLVIDPQGSGKFIKSAEPYSTTVTGIYSTKPGLVGRRQTTDRTNSTTEVPMAMIGIVPTKVSAENGPIRPGDLLVTSSTPGYAMKGSDRTRMLGAVIGKSLGSVDSGIGVVEVVVTLQ